MPADYPTMPFYFAGAACRASGAVDENEGQPIWMDLFINGELVAHWDWFQDVPVMPSGLQVMFDSSHFANGTTVTVEFDAYFFNGGETHASGSSIVKNHASLAARHDFETPAMWPTLDIVQAHTEASNYSTVARLESLGWETSAFLALFDGPSNVAYTITHGQSSPNRLTSDYDEIDPNGTDDQLFIYPPQVQVHRASAIGIGGLPPYNPSGNPPINIAVTNACGAGLSNVYAEAMLVPYENAYGKWCENQSELSWTDPFLHGRAMPYAMEDLWSALAQGYCVDQARVVAAESYKTYMNLHGMGSDEDPRQLLHVWGDFATRLHGVYNGVIDEYPQTNWYGERILL